MNWVTFQTIYQSAFPLTELIIDVHVVPVYMCTRNTLFIFYVCWQPGLFAQNGFFFPMNNWLYYCFKHPLKNLLDNIIVFIHMSAISKRKVITAFYCQDEIIPLHYRYEDNTHDIDIFVQNSVLKNQADENFIFISSS